MNATAGQRHLAAAIRRRLRAGRDELGRFQREGGGAEQACQAWSRVIDQAVLEAYRAAREQADRSGADRLDERVALLALGGYGRRETAPYSDVDLMLLHEPGGEEEVAALARPLTYALYDAGLHLGFSVRTPSQACSLAWEDVTVFSSLVDARLLAGSERLARRLENRFRRGALRRTGAMTAALERARAQELGRYGDTVYLLAPNVKRSPGGLRDIQMWRWAGFARYGTADWDELAAAGAAPEADVERLRAARRFLLGVRNELHLQAGRAQDVLDKAEQVRLAERLGFQGDDGLLPVEQFMRRYFQHTSEVDEAVGHLFAALRRRPLASAVLAPWTAHRAEGDFRIGPNAVGLTRSGLRKLHGDIVQVLRLMDLANLYNKPIDVGAWETIRRDMTGRPDIEVSPEAAARFLALLSRGARLGPLLRQLHQLRVLEKFICGLDRARCLMQFNEYHKYTVDEHAIRAVEQAAALQHAEGPVAEAYRRIPRKRTLHLALLIHDLGKALPGDHCEAGAELARGTAQRLGLPRPEAEMVEELVAKHLRMAHLAFRHDLHDEALLVAFAADVGSPDLLQMLYVHTYCDLAAVGPGVMTSWKLELLTELYGRTLSYLTDDSPLERARARRSERRRQLRARAPAGPDPAWWDRQIAALPPAYLFGAPAEHILEELAELRRLPVRRAVAWGRYLPDRQVVQYTVGAHEEIARGVFHRLTGALTAAGQQILSAEIHTLPEQLVLDRFYVQDMDYQGEPPPERLGQVQRALVRALERPSDRPPRFRRLWRERRPPDPKLRPLPTQVRWDNATSERHTIFTVFAYDRMGLLYAIARTLYELDLSVHVAKIGTYLDQVVDVFYVTDAAGRKIEDRERLERIRRRLESAVNTPGPDQLE